LTKLAIEFTVCHLKCVNKCYRTSQTYFIDFLGSVFHAVNSFFLRLCSEIVFNLQKFIHRVVLFKVMQTDLKFQLSVHFMRCNLKTN